MKKQNTIAYLLISIILASCAGSAQHDVVSAYRAGDESMSCQEIQSEIVRAQVSIDEVNDDKSGISGADVVDGLLWFPFNLIAKSQNYKNALAAADKRIERLTVLQKEKNCQSSVAETQEKKNKISTELKQLKEMYDAGDLTKEEFDKAKNKLLN